MDISKEDNPKDIERTSTCSPGEVELITRQHTSTKRGIKSRHAQMIAIGGTIGTGLFVGSGQALAIAGPGFLLLAYILMSAVVYGVVTALMEVSTYLPVSGSSTAYYATRYVSKSLGFAMGYLYFYSFGILVAYEITAAAIVVDYWPNGVHVAIWLTVMIVVIVALNFTPVNVYAEIEFWFASTKVIMIVGLLILSFILFCGGGPSRDRLGFRYWDDATKAYIVAGVGGRFTAFLYAWTFSSFSFFFGPELIVFTAGEMQNPRKNLPIASRRFAYRLFGFYILSALAIGVICNSNAPGLTSAAGNANASPWVIAIRNAGIPALDSIINAGILISAWSAGNAFLYMSSRALYSLAVAGDAPKIFARCTRHGLPVYAVGASSLFPFLAYLNCAANSSVVFNWFINLTNTAGFISWICCIIIFIRFRKACAAQGVTPPYRSIIQPYAGWISLFFVTILLFANGFTVFFPGRFIATQFLTSYIGIPIFLGIYLAHIIFSRKEPWAYSPCDVDLLTGVHEVEADAARWKEAEDGRGKYGKWWKKVALIWQ
ncbi:putative proline permease protein [Fusarium keratoplasticum]|nr:putative proline permease protein [Fusarium keratoplasticum]